MWAKKETDYPAGKEIIYECVSRTCGFTEKAFESR
jgi:hypothetical protein